jgi:glycosyltransferase involved in cell wall biosynthesis
MNKKLSIIIPVFNEETTIDSLLQKVAKVELMDCVEKELVIVNDGSDDNSKLKIEAFIRKNTELKIRYINNTVNKGKGFAVRCGILQSTGDYIIVQDADLEYNPEEYNKLLLPVLHQDVHVVYGSRFLEKYDYKESYLGHKLINKSITFLSNLLTGMNLTDILTCYKLFDARVLKKIDLIEDGFSFEIEVTAKLSKVKSLMIKEIAISYVGRRFSEKKIGWRDGLDLIYAILKYNLFIKIRNKRKKQIHVDDFVLGVNNISI